MGRMWVLVLGLLHVSEAAIGGWTELGYHTGSTHPADGVPIVGDVQTGKEGSFSYSDPSLADGERVAIRFETECFRVIRLVGHLTAGNMSTYRWNNYDWEWSETHFINRDYSDDEWDTMIAYDGNYYSGNSRNTDNITITMVGKGMPDGLGFAVDFTWECHYDYSGGEFVGGTHGTWELTDYHGSEYLLQEITPECATSDNATRIRLHWSHAGVDGEYDDYLSLYDTNWNFWFAYLNFFTAPQPNSMKYYHVEEHVFVYATGPWTISFYADYFIDYAEQHGNDPNTPDGFGLEWTCLYPKTIDLSGDEGTIVVTNQTYIDNWDVSEFIWSVETTCPHGVHIYEIDVDLEASRHIHNYGFVYDYLFLDDQQIDTTYYDYFFDIAIRDKNHFELKYAYHDMPEGDRIGFELGWMCIELVDELTGETGFINHTSGTSDDHHARVKWTVETGCENVLINAQLQNGEIYVNNTRYMTATDTYHYSYSGVNDAYFDGGSTTGGKILRMAGSDFTVEGNQGWEELGFWLKWECEGVYFEKQTGESGSITVEPGYLNGQVYHWEVDSSCPGNVSVSTESWPEYDVIYDDYVYFYGFNGEKVTHDETADNTTYPAAFNMSFHVTPYEFMGDYDTHGLVVINWECIIDAVCPEGLVTAIDGECRDVSDSLRWQEPWSTCGDVGGENLRFRPYRLLTCAEKSGATAAPWFERCDFETHWVNETCADSTVVCTDFNAAYDAATEQCECTAGLYDTDYGCLGFEDVTSAASDLIIDEIVRRLTAFQTAATWPTFSGLRETKTFGFWDHMKTRVGNKASKMCGKHSRAAYGGYYTDIQTLYKDFVALEAAADSDVSALVDMIKVFNDFMALNVMHCRESGFGPDPTSTHASADCTPINRKRNMKCKLQYYFANLFNSYAGADTLSFA